MTTDDRAAAGPDADAAPVPATPHAAGETDWPELDPGPPPTRRVTARRPGPIVLATALLAVDGVGGVISGLSTRLLSEPLANVAPVLTAVLGLGGLVAAVGVWRVDEWGRLVGLGVALGWLIRDGLLTQAALSLGLDPLLGRAPNPLFDWVLPLGSDVVILAVLALRWPNAVSAEDADAE